MAVLHHGLYNFTVFYTSRRNVNFIFVVVNARKKKKNSRQNAQLHLHSLIFLAYKYYLILVNYWNITQIKRFSMLKHNCSGL